MEEPKEPLLSDYDLTNESYKKINQEIETIKEKSKEGPKYLFIPIILSIFTSSGMVHGEILENLFYFILNFIIYSIGYITIYFVISVIFSESEEKQINRVFDREKNYNDFTGDISY